MKNISCPVSNEKLPEHLPRIIAFYNIVLMISFIIHPNAFVLAFLGLEFILRGFGYQQFSTLRTLSIKTGDYLQIKSKEVDKAPKLFAARLGGIMFVVALVLFLLGLTTSSLVIVGMVTALATLECVFSFCVGCYIYTFLVLPAYK